MATEQVVAQFKYSYEYEGKMISFKKGEIFQLLNTSNKDWWQVRRWLENGTCETLYVPANYMKIKKEESSHVYQNMADLQEEYKRSKGQLQEKKSPQTQPKTKLARTKSKSKSIDTTLSSSSPSEPPANGHPGYTPRPSLPTDSLGTTEPEYAIPNSPVAGRKNAHASDEPSQSSGPIAKEWKPGYSLPAPKKKTQEPSAPPLDQDSSSRKPDHTHQQQQPRKVIPTVLEDDSHRHQLESSLSKQLSGGVAPSSISSSRLAPAPKPKPRTRPKSYVIDDDDKGTEVSTFKTAAPTSVNTFGIPEERLAVDEPPLPMARRSFKRHEYDVPVTTASGSGVSTRTEATTSGSSLPVMAKSFQIPNPGSAPPIIVPSSPTPSPVSPLPDGWSEHRTPDGRTYYYNSFTGESKWTAPTLVTPPVGVTPILPDTSSRSNNPLEKVAPKGWTKEINPFSQTPIYTNCRSGDKWALGKDDRGFFYYNTAKTDMIIRDLPTIDDEIPSSTTTAAPDRTQSDNIYDHLDPVNEGAPKRSRALSEDDSIAPGGVALLREHPRLESRSSHPVGAVSTQEVDLWSSKLTIANKKYGYLQRKRLLEPGGKKRSDKWTKQFTVLQDSQLIFYNDHKTRDNPGVKPTGVFNLLRASISSATVKDKKKNVILVSSSVTGEQFYLQADSVTMFNDWYTALQATIDLTNEDCKKNPDKYDAFLSSMEASDSSPPLQSKFPHNRKISAPRGEDDDIEELEYLTGAEKTVRIKGRLRNLIARRPQVESLKKSGIMQESVFGCELSHLAEREHCLVPRFMTHFMEHIERKGLDTVGIYRLSGNAAQVQKLRYLVEEDQLVNLNTPEWADVNIITGCLKLYLRELPDPLIPFKQFRSFIDAARVQPSDKRMLAIRTELDRLPEANYHTLKALIKHLKKVVEFGHINKMQSTNVSIVFGPTVMRAEVDSIEMATLMPVQNNLVDTFLTETDRVFSK